MNAKLYQRCIEFSKALKSRATGKSTHFAFAIKKSKIIRIGNNDYHKGHNVRRFGRYTSDKDFKSEYLPNLHAEVSLAIRLGEENLQDHEVLVLRVLNTGEIGQSCPCQGCARLLRDLNVKNIYYSNQVGELEKLK